MFECLNHLPNPIPGADDHYKEFSEGFGTKKLKVLCHRLKLPSIMNIRSQLITLSKMEARQA